MAADDNRQVPAQLHGVQASGRGPMGPPRPRCAPACSMRAPTLRRHQHSLLALSHCVLSVAQLCHQPSKEGERGGEAECDTSAPSSEDPGRSQQAAGPWVARCGQLRRSAGAPARAGRGQGPPALHQPAPARLPLLPPPAAGSLACSTLQRGAVMQHCLLDGSGRGFDCKDAGGCARCQ